MSHRGNEFLGRAPLGIFGSDQTGASLLHVRFFLSKAGGTLLGGKFASYAALRHRFFIQSLQPSRLHITVWNFRATHIKDIKIESDHLLPMKAIPKGCPVMVYPRGTAPMG